MNFFLYLTVVLYCQVYYSNKMGLYNFFYKSTKILAAKNDINVMSDFTTIIL